MPFFFFFIVRFIASPFFASNSFYVASLFPLLSIHSDVLKTLNRIFRSLWFTHDSFPSLDFRLEYCVFSYVRIQHSQLHTMDKWMDRWYSTCAFTFTQISSFGWIIQNICFIVSCLLMRKFVFLYHNNIHSLKPGPTRCHFFFAHIITLTNQNVIVVFLLLSKLKRR